MAKHEPNLDPRESFSKNSHWVKGDLTHIKMTSTPPEFKLKHPYSEPYIMYDYLTPRTVTVLKLIPGARFRIPTEDGSAPGGYRCYGRRYVRDAYRDGSSGYTMDDFEYCQMDQEVLNGASGKTIKFIPRVDSAGKPIPWVPDLQDGGLHLELPKDAWKLHQLLEDVGLSNRAEAFGVPIPKDSSSFTIVLRDPLYTASKTDLEGEYVTAATAYYESVVSGDPKIKIALADYARQAKKEPIQVRRGAEQVLANEADTFLTRLRTDSPREFYNLFIRPSDKEFLQRAMLYLALRGGIVRFVDGAYVYMHPDTRSEFTLGATEAKAIASISETYHAIRQHIHEGTSIAHLISRLEHSDTQTMLKKVRGRVTAKETNVALPTPIERDSAGRLSGVPMMDSIKSIVGGKTGGASQTAHSIEVIQAMLDANNKALAVLADSTAKMADAIKKLAERQDTGTNTAQPPTRKWKEVVS